MFLTDPTLDLILRSFVLTAIGLAYVILLVRLLGLRSFSKMTNFDFVMTVATGTVLAGMGRATDWSGFTQAALVMLALFVTQYVIAQVRQSSPKFENTIQNTPVLLMRNGEFCEEALDKTRVSKSDVIAKLREANVLERDKVRAVILEATGDVSVMHGDKLEDFLIDNVTDMTGNR